MQFLKFFYFPIKKLIENITGKYTIKQIFGDFFDIFKSLYPKGTSFGTHSELLNDNIVENVEKMLSCRDTEKLGCTVYQCPNHPEHTIEVPHSCKSRFCNTCGKIQTDNWISSCNQLLQNVNYKHLTLTIPKELRNIFGR